jgi:hypothetical protein
LIVAASYIFYGGPEVREPVLTHDPSSVPSGRIQGRPWAGVGSFVSVLHPWRPPTRRP